MIEKKENGKIARIGRNATEIPDPDFEAIKFKCLKLMPTLNHVADIAALAPPFIQAVRLLYINKFPYIKTF